MFLFTVYIQYYSVLVSDVQQSGWKIMYFTGWGPPTASSIHLAQHIVIMILLLLLLLFVFLFFSFSLFINITGYIPCAVIYICATIL